jgi:hypothetical protein
VSKSSDSTCGARKPGWANGPAVGANRIPCLEPAGHSGEHRDGLGQTWANEPAPAEPQAPVRLRKLPFTGPEGKPAYVPEHPDSFLARIADGVEADQISTGHEVLKLSRAMLSENERLEPDECRYVMMRLSEALSDAIAVAESRGERLDIAPLDEPLVGSAAKAMRDALRQIQR